MKRKYCTSFNSNHFPITLFLLALFIFNGNDAICQAIKGNGKVKTEVRELAGFNRLIVQGNIELYLVQGETEGVRIEADENLVEFFQTRLDGKTLYITMSADLKKSTQTSVSVSFKELEQITLLDQVGLKSEKVLQFSSINILNSGLSKIEIELFASNCTIELNDGSYAYLKGYSEVFDVRLHDETELQAGELQTDYCKVKSSGLTEVTINAQKELALMVTGQSNVYYFGEPTITQRVFASNGFIVKRKATTQEAQ
jgi:hypothetical protein